MQVFLPFISPLETACCLDKRRLNKQVIECKQILNALAGNSKAWLNHPVTQMYKNHTLWLEYYMLCLQSYFKGDLNMAEKYNNIAILKTPYFISEGYCVHMRKRLYTKDKLYYNMFSQYGESDINGYFVENKWKFYKNGKILNKLKN